MNTNCDLCYFIALENQQKNIQGIQKSLENVEAAIKELPSKNDTESIKNQTINSIEETGYNQLSSAEKGNVSDSPFSINSG